MSLILNPQSSGQTPEPPKIEFPCQNYPVKVVGKAHATYQQVVLDIVSLHAPGFDLEQIKINDSRNGRFCAITVYITATGVDQLAALHKDLSAHELVHMVM